MARVFSFGRTMPQFVIKVPDIDPSGSAYRFDVPVAWLRAALSDSELGVDPGASPGALTVQAVRSGEDVVIRGQLEVQLEAECVRCLEAAPVHLTTALHSLFSARTPERRSDPTEEQDVTPEELVRELYSGEEIVLDELVRDQMILEAPMQPLCSDACQGIAVPEHVRPPPDFQQTDGHAVDPRLQPLEALAGKFRNKE